MLVLVVDFYRNGTVRDWHLGDAREWEDYSGGAQSYIPKFKKFGPLSDCDDHKNGIWHCDKHSSNSNNYGYRGIISFSSPPRSDDEHPALVERAFPDLVKALRAIYLKPRP